MPDQEQLIRRQQVLADFGDFALRSQNLDEVLTEACRLVAEALGTTRAKVLEIQNGGGELLVRAGVGWAAEVVGKVRLPMSERSSETFSIQAGKPVMTRDIRTDDRFAVPEFMRRAGVVALANVPIFVPGPSAYGLLQVDATEPREFGEEDTQFLRTYAIILGPVIDRLIKVNHLRSSEDRFRAFVTATSDVVYSMSPDWSEMRRLDGQGFLADTVEPSRSWMENYIELDDREVVQLAIGRAIRTKSMFELEHRVRRADGTVGWTLSRAVPLLDSTAKSQSGLARPGTSRNDDSPKKACKSSSPSFSTERATSSQWWDQSSVKPCATATRWKPLTHSSRNGSPRSPACKAYSRKPIRTGSRSARSCAPNSTR